MGLTCQPRTDAANHSTLPRLLAEQALGVVGVIAKLQPGNHLFQIGRFGHAQLFDPLTAVGRHGERHVEDTFLAFFRGDDDFLDDRFAFIGCFVCGKAGCCNECRDQCRGNTIK